MNTLTPFHSVLTPSADTQAPTQFQASASLTLAYTFEAIGITVRAFKRPDGTIWFVAKDVAQALGYRNVSQTLADHVSPQDKHIVSIGLPGRAPAVINESGLYALVLRSNKPQAQPFRQWVTGTVLPSINRRGGYLAGEERLSEADRDALHTKCQAELRSLVSRVDDDTWHSSLRHDLAERTVRAIADRAEQAGIPFNIAQRAYSGDFGGALDALVAAKGGAK
ncbi:MAG: hypothetical protein IPG98_15135 [Burkholderiales bacterium]|nr:hypothetical protein [Burkholderiales bacterium]MBK8667071.1 hypothetical protein [Burkholderiales bacterium]